jgi:ubiquinone/menaquinone biosynthesis C-methylase UbiE
MEKTMNNKASQNLNPFSYEGYNYLDFWKGRDYENDADKMAVSRLLSMIKGPREKLIDIGAGMGRISPLYETDWDEFVLLDTSKDQIDAAKKNIIHQKKAKFIVGMVESIPFPDLSFNTIVCIRTFHYVADTTATIKEISRILKPGGYVILEIPNKLHFKNRFDAILGKNSSSIFSANPINITTKDSGLFLNHNPKTILKLLKSNNFSVIEVLSVSNFRSNFIKKNFPTSFLMKLEKLTQKALAPMWFGPSIYFLARKLENGNE